MSQAQTPRGVNHVVLNVRNLEESHRFWTEVIGFKCVAALDPKRSPPDEFSVKGRDVYLLFPNGVGNESDQVGRNYCEQIMVHVRAFLPQLYGGGYRNDDGIGGGHIYMPRFNHLEGRAKPDYLRGFGMQFWSSGCQTTGFDVARHVPGFGKTFKAEVKKRYPALLSLHPFGEVLSRPENRVTVDESRTDRYGIPDRLEEAAHRVELGSIPQEEHGRDEVRLEARTDPLEQRQPVVGVGARKAAVHHLHAQLLFHERRHDERILFDAEPEGERVAEQEHPRGAGRLGGIVDVSKPPPIEAVGPFLVSALIAEQLHVPRGAIHHPRRDFGDA